MARHDTLHRQILMPRHLQPTRSPCANLLVLGKRNQHDLGAAPARTLTQEWHRRTVAVAQQLQRRSIELLIRLPEGHLVQSLPLLRRRHAPQLPPASAPETSLDGFARADDRAGSRARSNRSSTTSTSARNSGATAAESTVLVDVP